MLNFQIRDTDVAKVRSCTRSRPPGLAPVNLPGVVEDSPTHTLWLCSQRSQLGQNALNRPSPALQWQTHSF